MAPSNDERSGATRIDVAMPSVTLTTNTNNARNDTAGPAGCSCTSGNDVFYTFTLTQPELVYADSLGSGYDASLFLQNAAGMNLTDAGTAGGATCDDDDGFCGTGNQAQIVARLPAGTYFLVLSGCGAGAGTIHFQHLPAGNGASNRITPRGAEQMVMGTTSGAGTVTSACCSGGPENSYWFLTCATTAPVQFYASTCGGATFDTELEQRSAGRTPVTACNDDVGAAFACGQRSSLNSTIPAGTGLHTLLMDSCSGSGVYNITYSVGTCAAGQTWCGACFDTLNDVRHCGGCNRACAAGNNCIAGVCRTAPANDNRAGATLVSLAAAAVTLTGDTSAATHDAPGSCGCTTRGADVWFRFVLTQREYVYADTIGATWDTALLFANASGAVVPSSNLALGQTCDDNDGLTGCATGMQSQILARLDPGTYYLVLSGCGRGSAAVHFHHLPTGNGLTRFLAATEGAGYDGTTAGTGTVTATCCSNGPEDSFYWYTCGSFRGGAFTAQTCGRATWDTELDQRSATRSTVSACSDDACGRRSSLASTIPVGAGLHALYVDGCVATVSGNVGAGRYGVFITRP
jgi:uncharacterized lipoprotein YmbA